MTGPKILNKWQIYEISSGLIYVIIIIIIIIIISLSIILSLSLSLCYKLIFQNKAFIITSLVTGS